MNNKYNELLKYLKSLGIENVSKGERKALYKEFNSVNDVNQIKRELEFLFAVNKALITTYQRVSVSNIMSMYKSMDLTLMMKLYGVYEDIKSKSNNEIDSLRHFKEAVLSIMNTNESVNTEIQESLNETMKKSLMVKDSLYLTMIDMEKANLLFKNCLNRSKLFLKQCDTRNLERLIYTLKKDFNMSDDELVAISKKCATFFSSSSSAKVIALNKNIEEFKAFISKQSSSISAGIALNKLLEKDFKEVLNDAASVASLNQDAVKKTMRFLMGEKLSSLAPVNKELADLKGNFTPLQLARIYNESITTLGTSVEKISDVAYNVSRAYEKVFNSKIDFSKIINGNNFTSISQLSKADYLEENKKIDEIFEILSMFVSEEDMEHLLQNDMSFLIAPTSAVKKSLQEAVLISSNSDELRINVLKKIRNHFDIYEKQGNIERKEKVETTRSLNKINIKSIDEEQIKEVLAKLETSDEDIASWGKKWNKEEKEYRELAIQLDLEDINDQLTNLYDFLNITFVDAEQYIDETLIVKEMYEDLLNKYAEAVSDKKLSKKLQEQSIRTSQKFEDIKSRINGNISFVINVYEDYTSDLTREIEGKEKSYASIEKRKKRSEELDEIIAKHGITEENCKRNVAIVEDLNKFSKTIQTAIKDIRGREVKASSIVSNYFMFLKEENKNRVMNINALQDSSHSLLSTYFPQFIYSLEFDGLIDNADAVLGHTYNLPKISYKQYRRQLNDAERKYTDQVYDLYVKNMKCKEEIKELVAEYLDKYGISADGVTNTHDKIDLLIDLLSSVETQIHEDNRIIGEKMKYNDEDIRLQLEELMAKKVELEEALSSYIKKIEILTKEKITL